MMYFSQTVLSTVGYGDYYAITIPEMIIAVIIMFIGVGQFAWLLREAKIEIIASFDLKI